MDRRWLCAALCVLGLVSAAGSNERLFAQAEAENGAAAAQPEGRPAHSQPRKKYRKFAPGVEKTIEPELDPEAKSDRHDLYNLLKSDPTFGEREDSQNLATKVRFPSLPDDWRPPQAGAEDAERTELDFWGLSFTFKTVSFIGVDIPNDEGTFDRKNVWYLVYHVKNMGAEPVRFVPRFLLYSWDADKYYPDRPMPLAIRPIEVREDPNRNLLDSVSISDELIPVSTEEEDNSVWGVVTWSDIDPNTDRFSIFIQGLTNAYQWEDVGEGKRRYYRRTLQLNFWRPSDDLFEHEDEIRYGIPGEVDYRWDYK